MEVVVAGTLLAVDGSALGQDGPFSVAEGRSQGLTDGQLRSGRWIRPFVGVRSLREPETPEELAREYAPKMRSEAYFSHVTSALLHGIRLPLGHRRNMVVHVSVPPHVRLAIEGVPPDRPAGPGARAGRTPPRVGSRDLVPAGQRALPGRPDHRRESLLARGRPGRLALHSLVSAVEAGGRPRQAQLERALPELREGVRSPKETGLRRLLLAAGLPEPEVNGDVFDDRGVRVAECDLVYRAHRVVVEYEGAHRFTVQQGRKDVRRSELLRRLGWTVIRVVQEDFADPGSIIARVRSALAGA